MSPEQQAHLGALIYAAEQAALAAHDVLNPPGGITPVTDDQRVALAQAQALTSFAFTMAAIAQANPDGTVPLHEHGA